MASNAHRSETHLPTSRANFMILMLTTLLGIISLGYIGAALAYLWPKPNAGAITQDLGPIGANDIGGTPFNKGIAGPFIYGAIETGDVKGIFAVQAGTAGSTNPTDYLVLGQTCTHLGCSVAWTAESGTFNCPCHGSVYGKRGQNISGPAPRPLFPYNFSIKKGHLIVEGQKA